MKKQAFPPRTMDYPNRSSVVGKAFMISTLESHRQNRKDWERAFYDFIEEQLDPCGIPSQLETKLKKERVNEAIVSTNIYFDNSGRIPQRENIYQLAAVTFEGYSVLGKTILDVMESCFDGKGNSKDENVNPLEVFKKIITDILYAKAKPEIIK